MGAPTGRVAVVGAGSIGVGWAVVFARGGVPVVLQDPDTDRLGLAVEQVHLRLASLRDAGLLDEPVDVVAARATTTASLPDAVAGVAHVQEFAPEDLALKRALFAELDQHAPTDAVLASSSSAMPCSSFAAELPGRHRCLVVHPGNPPYLLPVVELVPAPFTAPDVVDRTEALLLVVGMSPVRVHAEVEGFVFNRLQGALLREAYCLVRDGVVSVADVDRVVSDGLGRRWCVVGPFATAELNTRGGIEAHARRLGPAYARMGAERGQDDPWTTDLVAQVASEVHAVLPPQRWEDSVRWRDACLLVLERARRDNALFAVPGTEGRGADQPAQRGGSGAVPDLERGVRELLDREAVTGLVLDYCRLFDENRPQEVAALFTVDAVVDYGPETDDIVGRDAIATTIAVGLSRTFAATSHHVSNVQVVLDGEDLASSTSYLYAWHRYVDGSPDGELWGRYRHRFVRTAEAGWRIAALRLEAAGTVAFHRATTHPVGRRPSSGGTAPS